MEWRAVFLCYAFSMVSFSEPAGLLSRPRLKRLHEVQAECYRLLQLLIPDDFSFHDYLKSRVVGSQLLRLQILERHAYTTFFRLTYEFPPQLEQRYAPDAHIRFYHDARLAEATSFNCVQACTRDTHPAYPARQMMQRAWRRNRALERWLDYLLKQGHSVLTMRPARNPIANPALEKSLVTVG
jgi:uncharacterized protein YqiB (DUF1249 family)